jgi:leader peptidase (prepilin peptidase)/N-methyltransferase
MDIVLLFFVFIFGTIIGSFLNVVVLRFNTGKTIGGRSMCMTCGRQLSYKELIPILSFVFQKGKCRKCKSPISWQYPIVEFITGVFFLLIFIYFPPLTTSFAFVTILQFFVASLLIVISVYDIKHKIIPNILVYLFIFASIVGLFIGGETWFHIPSISLIIAGPLLALPFALIGFLSKQTWMGLGDAKLVIGIGWLLGISGGVNAIVLSFWIAAIVSVSWLYFKYGKFKSGVEIPFGPFLILGMYLVLFFGLEVIDLSIIKEFLW